MSLRTLNIAPRAFLGFAVIGCLMLFLGIFALSQMSKIRAATERITQDTIPSIKSVDDFTQLSLRLRVQAYRLLLNRDPEEQQKTP
ncbi:MCP four helix bundle domain-containing protein, partial [Pseudomonas protegens]|uniref:MCP four helix bundle domain-containing protein n=1 Tax=Pseudomonas protegens TaxID=380021 RepID=UPI00223B2D41